MHLPERLLSVLGMTVLVVSAIGFVIGTDPDRYAVRGFSQPTPVAESANSTPTVTSRAQPARSYDELTRRPWGSGPGAGWAVDGSALEHAFREASAPEAAEHGRTPLALLERAERRAYAGAPPTIPHPVASSGAAECMACHGNGARLGALTARAVPHPAYASCTQCHVPASAAFPSAPARSEASGVERPPLASRFEPLRPTVFGPRAWPGAPPAIPHSTLNRSECLACHGPAGRLGMRSSHPERTSCLQCHAVSADLDQRGPSASRSDAVERGRAYAGKKDAGR